MKHVTIYSVTYQGYVYNSQRPRRSDIVKSTLWPKKIEACIADKTSLLTLGQCKNSATYMVGFKVDTLCMRGNQLNIELQMSHFREWELSRFQPLVPGMDIVVKTFECKNLPRVCFEIYGEENGKEIAMKRRRMLRDADPKRQERKRLRKLEALKAKMAEIQKRKESKKAAEIEETVIGEGNEVERKRKRSDADLEDETPETKTVKSEGSDVKEQATAEGSTAVVEEEEEVEANLLESALDALQDMEGGRTREEAEADRRKLLAGEVQETMVEEEEYVPADDEEFGYTLENQRQAFLAQERKPSGYKDIRSLPLAEEEAEILRKAGYNIVSDAETETKIIGGNQPTPFRQVANAEPPKINKVEIQFRTKFNIVELDSNGNVIDKGDEDFMPSKSWIGRKAGFEFKLGARGLGYYRTGKKVVVPSNKAY